MVGSVVPVNRHFYAATGCSARLSFYFRAGADARSAARELAGGGPQWRAAGGRDLRLPLGQLQKSTAWKILDFLPNKRALKECSPIHH